MGLMDKVKKILFDEEEVEIPVNEEKVDEDVSSKGFIDHGEDHDIEEVEEDTITEVILPSTEEIEDEEVSTKKFNFPDQFDFDDNEIVGTRYAKEKEEKHEVESVYSRLDKLDFGRKDNYIEKDYNSIINKPTTEKKPFKVSPTISPVYGIIDKDYVKSEPIEKKEIPQTVQRKRTFGPVSYNDDGYIDTPKRKSEILKEEIKEVNETITEMINEDVNNDEIKTSGIENEYIGNNNIEDAFESTSELNRIDEMDKNYVDDEQEVNEISVDEVEISKDENLDDTIETDLFNLIDSMYSSDDTRDSEEE